jgi:prepilin-type N-terminal cleavage/methylation domain-containing protein
MRTKQGMTLIELLIVLALMAGLAGLALSTVGELGHRGRQDLTIQRLERIRDGVERMRRDLGRGPWLHNDTDGVHNDTDGFRLQELWRDLGDIGFGPVSFDPTWAEFPDDLPESVSLRFGWNGPYIGVNDPATAELWDGFGNAWVVTEIDNIIQTITSRGSNGEAGGDLWHEDDLTLDLSSSFPTTELTVIVEHEAPALSTVRVTLFRAQTNASTRSIEQVTESVTAPDLVEDVTFSGLVPGPVRVFAHGFNAGPIDLHTSGSGARLVKLEPGSNVVTLTLRETP